MLEKGDYLCHTYGVPNLDAQFPSPYSYKEYCWLVLNCQFGGGVVTLYVVSCMWALKITVINSKALQQYRVQHHAPLKGVNTAIVFNVSCHFIAAGESQHLFHVIAFIASQQEIWLPVWVKLFLGKFFGISQSLVVACNSYRLLAVLFSLVAYVISSAVRANK